MKTLSTSTRRRRSLNALINYRLRTLGLLLFLSILISIPEYHGDWRRWLIAGLVLVWPHFLYWRTRHEKSTYKSTYEAEGFNILLDSILAGVLVMALDVRLFPATTIISIATLNLFVYWGWRKAPHHVGLLGLGFIIGYLLFGFEPHLDTEPLPTVLSIVTLVAYLVFIGSTTNKITTGLRRMRLALQSEKERSQELLRQSNNLLEKVFPRAIIPRLNARESPIADEFADVTVLFIDIVGYTSLAEQLGPRKTVILLNDLYRRFDKAAAEHGVEKIETVGDGYLAVCGAPERNDEHPEAVAQCALAMIDAAKEVMTVNNEPVQIRIGLHTGPIFAGVIGEHRFHYAIFGETVNVASRVQSHSEPGKVLVSESTYKRLKGSHQLQSCDVIELKGHGPMQTYWLQTVADS